MPARIPSLLLLAFLSAAGYAAEIEKQTIGQMELEGVPKWNPELRERLLQYLQVRPASLQSLSDDGKSMLINTRFGATGQVHLVSMPMGMRKQITFFDEPVNTAGFIPHTNDRRIAFGKDVGGNENTQFYVLDLDTGRHRLLTDGKSRNERLVIADNGKYLAWAGTARNGRDSDVYLFPYAADASSELSASTTRVLWQAEGTHYPVSFNPEATKLLVMKYLSERETRLLVVDLESGQSAEVTPASPPAYYGGGAWTARGDGLYITSDRDGEFRKLYLAVFGGENWKPLTDDINWDISGLAVDPTGKGIAFTTNEDGVSSLYFADANGQNRKAIADIPSGIIGSLQFNGAGGVLGFTLDSWRGPGDAYTVSFPDGKVTRWTESEIGGLNPERFVEPQLIRFPTFDEDSGKKRTIPAYYYRGRGEGPRPVVIAPHGGPESQYRPTFSGTFQMWANELGISVIAPNVRGSTGYGRSFHQLDNAVKREDSVKDIGALLDWIAQQPELDSKRVAIYGGSYGGYMVLASLVNYPERFKAGVDIVGIADFTTFLANTSAYRQDLRREEYGDERDPAVRAVLEQISPLRRADQIKASLFVIHGQNDPRVPVSEAKQIVTKMRELNRPVWFANALNEGHGFRKRENTDLMAILVAHFWQEQLLK